MFGLGSSELLLILLVVLVLFGGKKIPELMGGLGKGVRSFKKGMSEDQEEHTHTQVNTKKDQIDNKS